MRVLYDIAQGTIETGCGVIALSFAFVGCHSVWQRLPKRPRKPQFYDWANDKEYA